MKPVYGDINLQPGAHVGGLVQVLLAPIEWLNDDVLIDFDTRSVVAPAALKAGRNWLLIEFTPQSYDYIETDKDSGSGSYSEIALSGTINKYNEAVQQQLETMRYHQHVAILTDRNKRKKIVGNTDAGLRLLKVHEIKNNPNGKQSAELIFRLDSEEAAPYYLSDISAFIADSHRLIDDDGAFILYE
jgi:hypothetical protein